MEKISPERRIAISFIKPYREYIDSVLKPAHVENISDQKILENVERTLTSIFSENSSIPDNIKDDIKNIMLKINIAGSKMIMPVYYKLLGIALDNVLLYIEKSLVSKFSNKELIQLSEIADIEVVQKLFSMQDIFYFMAQERKAMKVAIQESLFNYMKESGFSEQIQSLLSDIMYRDDTKNESDFFPSDDDE